MARRDKGHKDKQSVPRNEFIENITTLLDEIQQGLFDRALARREEATKVYETKDDFYDHFKGDGTGFVYAHFCGNTAVEEQVKNDLKVTLRCIPLEDDPEAGTCIFTGKPSKQRVLWAKAY